MASDTFAGPVGIVVFTFPVGSSVAAGLQALLAQVDAGTVEVLDLEIIGRDADGAARLLTAADLPEQDHAALAAFDGAETDLLDDDDLAMIAGELDAATFAVAVLYEDRSLATAATAWAAAGGTELFSGGVALDDVADALDEEDER